MMFNFDKFKNSLAAIDESGDITYRRLDDEGKALAGIIRERCLVFCLCKNTIGSLIGYTGFLNSGIVPLLLEAGIDHTLLQNLVETYRPAYIWLPDPENADSGSDESKFDFEKVYRAHGFVLMKTNYEQYETHDELALLLTTSGSTGSPKLVRQSRKNITSNAEAIIEYLKLDSTERPITTLPMNYTYGLSVINSHLLVGATLLMTTKGYMQREFWQMFKEHGATGIAGVPYNYEMLKKLRFFRMDLPSLRYFTQAGGKLQPELHKEYAEYANQNGKRFYVMYGQTEATARMSYLPYERSLEKYGSIGIAIPGGEFSLIDENGETITSADTVGELVYRGKNVTLGYAERGEDLKKGDENGGVLVTGDMARRDRDGYYYIVGRKKRFLKIFGNRVNLDDCERLIKAEFDVDCACVGVDDKMTIFIVSGGANDVRAFISGKTGLNQSAFDVREVDAIPKNESGKTMYAALKIE